MARRKINSAQLNKEAGDSNSGSTLSFDERALSALTARIEEEFGAGKPQQAVEVNRGQKGINGTKHQKFVKVQSKTKPVELVRGTKRDIRGNAKQPRGVESFTKQKYGKGPDDRAILLKEILALGGTEEDLDLVADAVSDEEDVDSNGALPDKSFRKELANFVAGLGIDGELDKVRGDDSDKEDIGDDWEDASDLNGSAGSDEEVVVEPVTTAPPPKPLPENPKRLVSTTSVEATGLTDSK